MTRWLYVSIALTGAVLAGSLYVYFFEFDRLPERVPIHWNIHGEPDGWTDKHNLWMTFLLLPGAMAAMTGLTLLLPWLSPRHFEVDAFKATYGYIMTLAVGLMGYLQMVILWTTFQQRLQTQLLFGGMFLFFALIGNVLGRVRRNFWMGVRTPWTLASDAVWIQTHRLTAWLFVAMGVIGFIAVLAGIPIVYCFAALIAVLLIPVLYSLVLYKRLEKQGKL
jgi:uncharacterized membrane protein